MIEHLNDSVPEIPFEPVQPIVSNDADDVDIPEFDPNQLLFEDLGEMTEGPHLPLVKPGAAGAPATGVTPPAGSAVVGPAVNPLFHQTGAPEVSEHLHAGISSEVPGEIRPENWSLSADFDIQDQTSGPVADLGVEWHSSVADDAAVGTIMPTDDEADLALSDESLKQEIRRIPECMAFKIGDVAQIVDVKTYVLRYWETEFEALKPKKSKFNQRMYTRRDVEILLMIKKLLYTDRFSIEGARLALRRLRKEVRADRQWDSVQGRIDHARERVEDLLGDLRELKELFF